MTEVNTPTNPNTPYVVSADVQGLLGRWASAQGYRLPSTAFFNDLTLELSQELSEVTASPVEIVTEAEMRNGMARLITASELPVVSLDRAYFDDGEHDGIAGYIDVTRAMKLVTDESGMMSFVRGEPNSPRPGCAPLEQQLASLPVPKGSSIALLDDVIFEGESALDLIARLDGAGYPVRKVLAGIAISEGATKLEVANITVEQVRRYNNVVDEVCERDFFAGVPMSGRTVMTGDDGEHFSAPYFRPFGNTEWATIPPDQAIRFSRYCVGQSVELWSAIEAASDRLVSSAALPRTLAGANGEVSVTMLLQRQLDEQ